MDSGRFIHQQCISHGRLATRPDRETDKKETTWKVFYIILVDYKQRQIK